MYGKVMSCCVSGVEGRLVEVEVDISPGLPVFQIVGLPDSSVRESMERVRAALKNCGFEFPLRRITINLAPADLKKEGTVFDLAIAIGILATSGQLRIDNADSLMIFGELALDGKVKGVPGVLSMVHQAKRLGLRHVVVPPDNVAEACLISGITVLSLSGLEKLNGNPAGADLLSLLETTNEVTLSREDKEEHGFFTGIEDYADVRGQLHAKRALMIAASGMHNILFIGPPGSDKTMLLRRLPTILPPLDDEEAMEVTKIYSVANLLRGRRTGLLRQRPFRSPHHTISQGGLSGGGSVPRPGELSLAHRGVLFLDEMPEYPRSVLEALRQPLEDKQLTISRARAAYTFPCDFLLAASMNPCPCGYLGTEQGDSQSCQCHPHKIRQYRARLSGPLTDRIDLQVEVPRIEHEALIAERARLGSQEMREQVLQAWSIQQERYRGTAIRFNEQLRGRLLDQHCRLDASAQQLLSQSFERLSLSARAYGKILKVARTIADLSGVDAIEVGHLAEALQYRNLDRVYQQSGI